MPTIRVFILFFTTLFFIPACFAEESGIVVGKFLEYLKAKRFAEAVTLFSDELRFRCPEQELSKVMNQIERGDVYFSGQEREREKQTGELESFDTVKKVTYQNGILYESILRFKNAVLQCRCAVDAKNKISAFEFLAVPNEFVPDHGPRYFNSTEIGKILGFDHSITIELFDADGKKIDFSKYNNYQAALLTEKLLLINFWTIIISLSIIIQWLG